MDCSMLIPDISYREFSKRLHKAISQDHIPIGASIDLTSRCNLNCLHCYIKNAIPPDELSFQDWVHIFDELVEAGCLWILFTGGEPLLRKDFKELYIAAKKKGLLITLFTNGTLINNELADFLNDLRPFSIEITLYGATRDIYEKVTGVSGSFEKCMRGIDLLLQRSLPLKLKSMILTINQHELPMMLEMAKRFGTEFRYDALVNSRLDGSKEPCSYRLSTEETVKLDYIDARRIPAMIEYFEHASQLTVDEDVLFYCSAGRGSLHIDANGYLCLCSQLRKDKFDLREGSFAEAWNSFVPELLSERTSPGYKCNSCDLLALCDQCPGWAELENGDKSTVVDYLCKLTHLRSKAFSIKKTWK